MTEVLMPWPLADPQQTLLDPPGGLRELREQEPVRRFRFPDGTDGWLLTRHDDVRAVLADKSFSSHIALTVAPSLHGAQADAHDSPGLFLHQDPPDHRRYRKLLTREFSFRRMRALRERIAEIVEEALNQTEAGGSPTDLVTTFCLPVPSMVICELLGVPYEDRDFFQRQTARMLELHRDDEGEHPGALIYGYLTRLVAAKRAEPGDDVLSGLTTATVDDGRRLTPDELVGMANLLLVAGHETTANMLGLGTLALLQHPAQWEALRADPDLAEPAVEELLRYLTIIRYGLVRRATADVEIGGRQIRAGECVIASLAAANRDPERFPDPDDLDLRRDAGQHLAFGHGLHQCLGQQLAREEMRIGFTALVRRFPRLRLAVPAEQIRTRASMLVYGVRELPVTW